MARFSQLEFDQTGPERKGPQGGPVHDAAYFYREALRSWLAGDFEPALRNYSRVLERNNTLFEAWLGQILMLIELGEYSEAVIWADKTLELFPDQPELFAAKAIACCRDLKMDKAITFSDISVGKNNTTSYVWLARAEVMFDRKATVAESCLSKAVGMAGKEIGIIRLQAARLLRQKGSYSAAMEHLNEAVRIFPKSALAWYELGCCRYKLGLPQAEAALEESLKLRPKWDEAASALSKCKSGFFSKFFRR